MILTIHFILALLIADPNSPPNYYPGMLSAREASRNSGKEMVVFFSEKTCNSCGSAWTAYIQDQKATGTYVSTSVEVSDFDGGIFYDLLELKEVPAWVIFTPDGKEKERWYGGWKDAGGKPTMYVKSTTQEKPDAVPVTPKTTPSSTKTTTTPTTISSNTLAETKMEKATTTPGFVVQAGYFGSEANANKVIDDLNAKGLPSFTIKQEQKNGSIFYRVISMVLHSEEEATMWLDKLSNAGIKGSVKKMSEI